MVRAQDLLHLVLLLRAAAGVRVIRAYAQEKAEVEQFEALNKDYIQENIGLARIQGMFMPLLQALIGLTFLLVLWAGGRQLMMGKISLGSFVMFTTYVAMLVRPITTSARHSTIITAEIEGSLVVVHAHSPRR